MPEVMIPLSLGQSKEIKTGRAMQGPDRESWTWTGYYGIKETMIIILVKWDSGIKLFENKLSTLKDTP